MATQPRQAPSGPPPTPEELLQTLRLLCNGSGERRASERWPVELPLEGWLQLEGNHNGAGSSQGGDLPPIPVDLVDISSGGVQVWLGAQHAVPVGQRGVLITQAHGGGCGYRQVRCCWQRPHPQHPQLQCLGLAFDGPN